MRTEIELWIGGRRADLSESSFILMNYTQEELQSPAVVRNAFSKQVTLPGTPANNDIFGGIWRNDRITQYGASQVGPYFDPTRKTEFRIYNERSEVLESGYIRLNAVARKGRHIIEYKVTLYGGLGSFIYGLMYDENGEKRTLAGLDFLNTASPSTEFNFTLEAENVLLAWTRLGLASGALDQMWDCINFAPCYNGLPGGTFDAKKGILDVQAAGISDGSGTSDGLALVSMDNDYTEWNTRDLRSYLQRPVLRLRAVMEAIAASRNNGGWTVNLDPEFFSTSNPYYNRAWMTLPIVNTDNLVDIDSGSGTLTWEQQIQYYEYYAMIGDYAEGRQYRVVIRNLPIVSANANPGTLYLHAEQGGIIKMSVLNIIVYGYDADDNIVAQKTARICSRQEPPTSGMPPITNVGTFELINGTLASWTGDPIQIEISGEGIKKVVVYQYWEAGGFDTDGWVYTNPADLSSAVAVNFPAFSFQAGTGYSYSTAGGGRSGLLCTKENLLSIGITPADFLLAVCKTFGLVMVSDGATKTVDILLRKNFYNGGVKDISQLVDISSIEKEPFAFSARWYVWAAEASGEWAKTYKEKYGKVYGQQRVDTGFDFDANTSNVLDGVAFKGGVMALENNKYYCKVVDYGDHQIPAVLLDRGAKYTRVSDGTDNEDVDIKAPSGWAAIQWFNNDLPTYDTMPKLQLHDADNKAIDGSGILVFYAGMTSVNGQGYALTDDTRLMLTLNNGTPCWLLNWAQRESGTEILLLPHFSRYMDSQEPHTGLVYDESMDFGVPSEVPIPAVVLNQDGTVFKKFWRKYIGDRYDDDSAVIRCKVDLSSFRVNAALLRSFFWFDGAVWALNKVINHSVTTGDLTECEFVKVQDTANYTSN